MKPHDALCKVAQISAFMKVYSNSFLALTLCFDLFSLAIHAGRL